MHYRYRLATQADAADIVRIVNLAYRVEDFFKIGDRTYEAEVREIIASDQFVVAEDESAAMAGCVEVRITGDRGYFGMLSVEPQRQKTGLGAGLIEQAEALALERGCRVMDLTYVNVREELPAFYERFGYRRTGTSPWERDEPTRFPVHFVNMSKELAPRAAAESRS
jgi:GNAT superfamily N-acetyltransferase